MGFIKEKGIKAVLFDIDGTLYDKKYMNRYLLKTAVFNPIFSLAYNKMRQTMRHIDGFESKNLMSLSDFRRKEANLLYSELTEAKFSKYLSKYEKIEERWTRYYNGRPFEGMVDTLREAKNKGIVLGALSDFPLGRKLEVLGVDNLVSYKASTEDCGFLKPNPAPFLVMLKALNLKPEEAIYLGDSYSKDVVGAKSVGMYTLLITKKRGDFPKADLVVKTWNELYNKLF